MIRGVEITNNVEEKRSVVVETILKPLLSKQNSTSREGFDDMGTNISNLESSLNSIATRKLLDFRDKKLPPSLIMFAQVSYWINHVKYNDQLWPFDLKVCNLLTIISTIIKL